MNAVVLLWLNDDKAREIDNDPSEVMFRESSESNMSRDEVCLFIGQCFGDRLYLKEEPSLTLNARIMCPGLMVRVTIREAPGSTNRSDFYNLIGHSNDYAVVVCRIGTQSSRWIPRR